MKKYLYGFLIMVLLDGCSSTTTINKLYSEAKRTLSGQTVTVDFFKLEFTPETTVISDDANKIHSWENKHKAINSMVEQERTYAKTTVTLQGLPEGTEIQVKHESLGLVFSSRNRKIERNILNFIVSIINSRVETE